MTKTARLIEVIPIGEAATVEHLRRQLLMSADPRLRVLTDTSFPSLVIETIDLDIERICQLLPESMRVDVRELRRAMSREWATRPEMVATVLTEARGSSALAVGLAAVERAAQRRRLEFALLAHDLDDAYLASARAILLNHAPNVPIDVVPLATAELGRAVGARRAGCVGVLRGRRQLVL